MQRTACSRTQGPQSSSPRSPYQQSSNQDSILPLIAPSCHPPEEKLDYVADRAFLGSKDLISPLNTFMALDNTMKVVATEWIKPESLSTPMWAFMPKNHWLPLRVWCISGSLSFLTRVLDIGDAREDPLASVLCFGEPLERGKRGDGGACCSGCPYLAVGEGPVEDCFNSLSG